MLKDIVYVIGPQTDPAELTYSLRSVEVNFPHRLVWIVGTLPPGIKPDRYIKHEQVGRNKWDLIKSSMLRIIKETELTEDFFWFNDDFFIMKPVKETWTNFCDGTLEHRVQELHTEGMSPYCRSLYKAEQELMALGASTMNYDVHLPMLFNKAKVPCINQCSSPQMRSIYGNLTQSPYIIHPDVKVHGYNEIPPNPDYLSTNEDTFQNGKAGLFIRSTFTKPSRFET